jgi:hypothetical protein
MNLAVDYDGTLFEGMYPQIGKPIMPVILKTKAFMDAGAETILWTCREGDALEEAICRCQTYGLIFTAHNEITPSQKHWNLMNRNGQVHFAQRKIYADLYVDDKSPGSIDYFLQADVAELMKKFVKHP